MGYRLLLDLLLAYDDLGTYLLLPAGADSSSCRPLPLSSTVGYNSSTGYLLLLDGSGGGGRCWVTFVAGGTSSNSSYGSRCLSSNWIFFVVDALEEEEEVVPRDVGNDATDCCQGR